MKIMTALLSRLAMMPLNSVLRMSVTEIEDWTKHFLEIEKILAPRL